MSTITTTTPTRPTLSGEQLTAAIRHEHEAASAAAGAALGQALEAGRLLTEARQTIRHGGWESFVRTSCGIAPRTASLYLRLHRHRDRLPNRQRAADLTVRQAARLLEQPKAKVAAEPVVAVAETAADRPAAATDVGLDRHPEFIQWLSAKANAEWPLSLLRRVAAELPESIANDCLSFVAAEHERLAEWHRTMERWYSTPAWYRPDSLIVATHEPTKSWVEFWPHPRSSRRVHVILHAHREGEWNHFELPPDQGRRPDELEAFLAHGESEGIPWNDRASWAFSYEPMTAERTARYRPYLIPKKRRRAARQGATA